MNYQNNIKSTILPILSMVTLISLFNATICYGAEPEPENNSTTKGYNCLFMGHSFFAPIAKSLAKHPQRCGFTEHKQTVVFHPGKKGTPGMMWKSPKEDIVNAKKLIGTGTVDYLGLTHYLGIGSDLSDYQLWIDLALKHNPNTRFVIQASWAQYKSKTFDKYEADCEARLKNVKNIIDQLRKLYPSISFQCIPQGRWMTGLWRLFNEGNLPEISVVKRALKKDRKGKKEEPYLFADRKGHGGRLPVKMGTLLWLAVIYKVDLNKYQFDTDTKYDLKKLAQDIAQNDPYCGLKTVRTDLCVHAPQ